MSDPIPFLLYSDGPRQPTGLARIARDLASRLWAEQEAGTLPISLCQTGWDPRPGPPTPWPCWSLGAIDQGDESTWGAGAVDNVWRAVFGADTPGVLLSIWDPGRAYSLLGMHAPVERWIYGPLDAVNVQGSLGGPAREAIEKFDRVIAYGRWASEALSTIRHPVPFLPHGLDLAVWDFHLTEDRIEQAHRLLRIRNGEVVIGCLAANQPRKDLGLFFWTIYELRRRGLKVRAWLHTDLMIRAGAWNVHSLLADFGLERVCVVTMGLSDEELAACYACCGCTIAPGLAEGFGYPIVESYGCGTPCVHVDYGGGAELVPLNAWKVPVRAWRLEGFYSLKRPVLDPVDVANAVERALAFKRNDERTCQEYVRGAVTHLEWSTLWPRWQSWIRQGLEEFSG